jgi:hypothetical protein
MSTLPQLNHSALDGNGKPIPGAKLYFYETGTTTPLDTFSDEALENANTNPVVADGSGRFGAIYLDTENAYTVKFTTSAGVTIWTRNDIRANSLASAGLALRIQQIASTPLDYGAIGDGAAFESAQVQQAIDAATSVVDLLGKTYKCDTGLTLRSGITLKNGTLNFASSTENEYITAEGSTGTPILLSGNAVAGDETITLASVTGLAVGDWLYLQAADSFGGGSDHVGELVKIKSIATLTVGLVDPLFDGYTTANTASVSKVSMVSRVTVEDLNIICSVAAPDQGRALYFDQAEGVTVRNVRITSPKTTGIELRSAVNASVADCTVTGSAVTGVGFEIGSHSRNVSVYGCQAYLLNTGFRLGQVDTSDGVTRMCSVLNCGALGCAIGFRVMVNSESCTVGGYATKISGASVFVDAGTNTLVSGVSDLTGPDGAGLIVRGLGTEPGIDATGGASSGEGVYAVGGEPGGYGLIAEGGSTNGVGLSGLGYGAGEGARLEGGASGGKGLYSKGGATNGPGVYAVGGVTNGPGVQGFGTGTGAGVYGQSPGGHGVVAEGDTTSPVYAALRVVPQDATPSTKAAGDIWVNSATGIPSVCTTGTAEARLSGVVHAATAESAARNTTGTFDTGSYTIPAGTLRLGSRVRIRASAKVTGAFSGGATLAINATVVSPFGVIAGMQAAYTDPSTTFAFCTEADIVVRQASGSHTGYADQLTIYGPYDGSLVPYTKVNSLPTLNFANAVQVDVVATIAGGGSPGTVVLSGFSVEIC